MLTFYFSILRFFIAKAIMELVDVRRVHRFAKVEGLWAKNFTYIKSLYFTSQAVFFLTCGQVWTLYHWMHLTHKVVVFYLTKFFFWLLSKFELCATESKLLETKLCYSSEKKLSVELGHFTGNHRAKFKPVMNGKRGCFEIEPLYSLSSNRTEIEHYPPLHYENMCNALCVHVLTGLYNHYLPKYTCI